LRPSRDSDAKAVNCCAIDGDGSRVFIGCHTGVMRVLDVETGEQVIGVEADALGVSGTGAAITAITPSTNGKLIITGHVDGRLVLWNVLQNRLYLDINAHAKEVRTAPPGTSWKIFLPFPSLSL